MYFNWERKYATGIKKIDSQHRKLVEMINNLYEELVIKGNTDYIDELLMDLKIYTISHFTTEEKMFTKYNYKGEDFEKHIEKHEQFKNKIAECMGDTVTSKKEIAYNLSEYLKGWLVHHILDTDMKFSLHMKRNHFTEITADDIIFDESL